MTPPPEVRYADIWLLSWFTWSSDSLESDIGQNQQPENNPCSWRLLVLFVCIGKVIGIPSMSCTTGYSGGLTQIRSTWLFLLIQIKILLWILCTKPANNTTLLSSPLFVWRAVTSLWKICLPTPDSTMFIWITDVVSAELYGTISENWVMLIWILPLNFSFPFPLLTFDCVSSVPRMNTSLPTACRSRVIGWGCKTRKPGTFSPSSMLLRRFIRVSSSYEDATDPNAVFNQPSTGSIAEMVVTVWVRDAKVSLVLDVRVAPIELVSIPEMSFPTVNSSDTAAFCSFLRIASSSRFSISNFCFCSSATSSPSSRASPSLIALTRERKL